MRGYNRARSAAVHSISAATPSGLARPFPFVGVESYKHQKDPRGEILQTRLSAALYAPLVAFYQHIPTPVFART